MSVFLVAKIQAKYKGYRTRGEFKKQKEAGTSFHFRYFLEILSDVVIKHTCSYHQLLKLKHAGEEYWRGKRGRNEPGLSKSSKSK